MHDYKPLRGLAGVVTVLLALNALSAVVTIGSSMMQLELLDRVAVSDYTDSELDSNDDREQTLGFLTMGLYLVTAIGFIAWFKRAYENLTAFGQPTAHGTGWAIGSWIVPIVSLFRPFQIAREIWNKSDPALGEDDVVIETTPPILAFWWGAWILGNVAGQVSFRLSMGATSPGDFHASTLANVATDVITLVSAPLAILVVRGITARQEKVAARFRGDASPTEF
jgi:hypothetical protein